MFFYKYYQPERTRFFRDGLLRFTQLGDLNDPFETSIKRFASGVAVLGDSAGAPDIFAPYYQKSSCSPEDERSAWQFTIDHLNRDFGVLCVSEVADSQLMWAHYATNHTGFVIGFDGEHSIFDHRISAGMETCQLRQVAYLRFVPHVTETVTDASGKLIVGRFDLDRYWLVKGIDWAYEREWRMLMSLSRADQRIKKEPFDICLFETPFDAVATVTLGARCSHSTQEEITLAIRNNPDLSHVQLSRTVIDEESGTIRIDSLN